jgi:DNA-binding transcriptional ArsR family regulator
VSVHENATALLRPTTQADDVGLAAVESVLNETLNRPSFLDDSTDEQFTFVSRMLENAEWMRSQFRDVKQTAELELPDGLKKPAGIDAVLFVVGQGQPIGQTLRIVMAATVGELSSLSIVVGTHFAKGGEKTEHRHLEAVWNNEPNRKSTTWFADATAGDELIKLLPNLVDQTPRGRLESVRKTVEIPRDVTIGTAPKTVQNVIRGVLADRPHAQRVGIICHQGHKKAIDELEPIFRDRIVKIEHFGSGLDRSTNSWHRECDFLLVVGTPRVPPSAVQNHLVRIGHTEAAAAESGWGPFRWQGTTESGENVIVEGRAYKNEQWQAAHRALVRSALLQAAGRARNHQVDGIEAVIVSTEEIGQTLSDSSFQPLGKMPAMVLQAIGNNSDTNANKLLLGKMSELSEALGVTDRTVRRALAELETRGLVRKNGETKGTTWAIVRHGEGEPEALPVSVCPENDETLKIQGNSGEIAEASGNDEIRPPSRPVTSFRGGGPIEPSGKNGVLLE